MTKHETIKAGETLASSMAAAFAEIEAATKSATNPHFKSKYADLGAVIDAVKPALIAHGLFFTQHPEPSEDGVIVETVLHHAGGESLSLGKLYVPANKRDAQGFGSAMTYARRYGLQTGFGVPTEDDDGNAAVRSAAPSSSAPIPAKIADGDRDLIQTLAPAAGKTVQGICEAYKIGSLAELTEAQAKKLIERLQSEAKEPANA
jgi:hypothetical protein